MQQDHQLKLSGEEMRALGYAVIDMLVDYVDDPKALPLIRTPDGRDPGIEIISRGIPKAGVGPQEALKLVREQVLADFKGVSDPRFLAYIPAAGNFVGAMADAIASAYNIFAGTANHNHGPTQVEKLCIDWLCGLARLPPGAGGLFVSGGSAANLVAIVLARHFNLQDKITGARAYCSEETHSSVAKAFRILGFAKEQLVKIPCDDRFRLRPDVLERNIADDRAAGLKPFLIIGTMGTTNTGAIDPLRRLAEIAARERLWLHVDAAYGAGLLLSEDMLPLLEGIESAHSITMDQHKWFFQPIECATILVRDFKWLHDVFYMTAPYLRDSDEAKDGSNYRDYGIQLTRSFRALKLWLSLQVFGEDAFRKAVSHGLTLARRAADDLAARDCWQLMSPAETGIVTFRYRVAGLDENALDTLNDRINQEFIASGEGFITTTQVNERIVLRFCTINPRVDVEDLTRHIDTLQAIGARLSAEIFNH